MTTKELEKAKVTQHNLLTEYQHASVSLSLTAKKVCMGIISQIRQEDKDVAKEYVLHVQDFADLANMHIDDPWTVMHNAARELNRTEIKVTNPNDLKEVTWTTFVSSLTSKKGEGAVRVHLDHRLKSYLIDLKKEFTEYMLTTALRLDSNHAIRIYEILKQYEKIGERKCTVKELREWLGLKNEYKRINDLKEKVIKVALNEISLKTDINVTISETHRRSRQIEAWTFSIKTQKGSSDKGAEKKKIELKPEQRELLEGLAAAQVNGTDISSDDYLNACIEYAQTQTKPINHPAKYLQKCLLEDFPGLLKNKKDNSKKITTQKVQKTGFHLPESRGKDYTNDELEKILLAKKKKSTIP